MGHELFLHGDGKTPVRLEANSTATTDKFPVPDVYKQGSGDIEITGDYTGDSDLEINIDVIESDTVSSDTGIISDPSFSGGNDKPNSDALVIYGVGEDVEVGEYEMECVDPSNPQVVGSNTLISAFVLEANGYREGDSNHYVDAAHGGIDLDGDADNEIRMEVHDLVSSVNVSVALDVLSYNSGSGITYTPVSADSADFKNYASTLFTNPIDFATDYPIISDSGEFSDNLFANAPLFLWGTETIQGDTDYENYPVRGGLYRQFKISKDSGYQYKLTNPDSDILVSGLKPYHATGSLIIHFYVRDSAGAKVGELTYTHYLDDSGNPQPIRLWGELAKAIQQHREEHIYVHPDYVSTNYVVATSRHRNPMVRVKFSESVSLPHSNKSITDWQNTPISFTSYSAARKISIEGTELEMLAMFKVLDRSLIKTEDVTITPILVSVGDTSQYAFQVNAPKTLEAMGITDRSYLAQLSYDQRLSTYFQGTTESAYLGFDLRITNPNSEVVVDGGSTCDRKLKYKIVTLVGDTDDNPRSFHPVLDNVSGPESFPTYDLIWSKYVPPLCSSIPDQSDYDNCIYDLFSGNSDTSLSFPYFSLSSGDAYRPNMDYIADVVNPFTNSTDINNTHTFKHTESSSYLSSDYRRSGEFLPYMAYVPSLNEALVSARLNDIDDYIEKFAESALDYEVVTADDGTYYILMGAKEFTPETSGSYIPSNEIDPFFEGTCAGFFEPLTGSPNRTLADGKIYSWPVASAFRDPSMKLGTFVPRQSFSQSDPALIFPFKPNTLPVFPDDGVYYGHVTNYSNLFPLQASVRTNVSDSKYNLTNHIYGLFASVYNFVDNMLDGSVTEFGTGFTLSEIRSECIQILGDLITYANDPQGFAQSYLAGWFTVDAEFIRKTHLYEQIALQPRDNLNELGLYNFNSTAASRKLPLYDNAEDYKGMLDGARHLGSMPYTSNFKTQMVELIHDKLGTSGTIADEKIFLVCKPDAGFWSVMNHTGQGSNMEYIKPYSHWGSFDNNRMMDLFMCRISKSFMKTKWLIDLDDLKAVLPSSMKPNAQQYTIYSNQSESTSSGVVWEIREEDYWFVDAKTILQVAAGGTDVDMGSEMHDRVYNGVTWASSLGDVTFRIQFPCAAELDQLKYGDKIQIYGTNSSYIDDADGTVSNLLQVKITINNSQGDTEQWTGGRDIGGDSLWKITKPFSDVIYPISLPNTAGSRTVIDLGDTENNFSMAMTPVIPFSQGESFSWYVQGGEYVVRYDDGTPQAVKYMSKEPVLLKDGIYITWLFSKGVPFYPGDWWRIKVEQPYGISNTLLWEKRVQWKSATATNACVLFELPTADNLDAIALVGHNLTSGASVKVLGFDPAHVTGYASKSVDDLMALWTTITGSVEVSLTHPGGFSQISGNAPYVMYPEATALGSTAFKAYLIKITDASVDAVEISKIHMATSGDGLFEVICGHDALVSVRDNYVEQKSIARIGDVYHTDSAIFSVSWVGFISQTDFVNIRNLFTETKRNNSEPFVWVPNVDRPDAGLYVRVRGSFEGDILDGFYRNDSVMTINNLKMETA